ncbi:MAG: hypothetical protein M1834_003176 [Cirrosporium novae-zelandiae]|nr:MAG: hypothetical protein M1834_003176 [Cirrosporium novae-zelandiae]
MKRYYEFDPKGEVIFSLDSKYEVSETSDLEIQAPPIKDENIVEASAAEAAHADDGEVAIADEASAPEDVPTPTHDSTTLNTIRMRASLKHLTLASHYFSRILSSPANANTIKTKGYIEIELSSDENASALVILLNIIHGYPRGVPQWIDFETFTDVAILVDNFECREVIELYSDIWIKGLARPIDTCLPDVTGWLYVCWVFRKLDKFNIMRRFLQYQSTGPIDTFGLLIPDWIVDNIEKHRQEAIRQLVSALYDLVEELQGKKIGHSFACTSLMLGALLKAMKPLGLGFPRPEAPFTGFCINELVKGLRNMKNPVVPGICHDKKDVKCCLLMENVALFLNNLKSYVTRSSLESFSSEQGGLSLWLVPK